MYRISFYVPAESAESVKEALFTAGAGRLGDYDRCSWETSGTGQFRPFGGARPAVGNVGNLERLEEVKIEMICGDSAVEASLEALLKTHPYEEPAYAVWPVLTLGDFRSGAVSR